MLVEMAKKLYIPKNFPIKGTIGFLVGQMENVRMSLLNEIKDLTQEEIDYTPNIDKVETIGTLLFHIADVENSWMFEAIDGQELDFDKWKYSFPLRQTLNPRQQTGKPLEYYLALLNETRENVKKRIEGFSEKDAINNYSNRFGDFTLEWVLYHNQQHESHHIGQINLLKRMYRYSIGKV